MRPTIYKVPASQSKTGKDLQFTLKPTSMDNRDMVKEFIEEFRQGLLKNADAMRHNIEVERLKELEETGEFTGEIPEELPIDEFDEYEFYLRLFEALTDGPHNEIDPRKFDVKIAEVAKDDFLPSAFKTTNDLMRSLLS